MKSNPMIFYKSGSNKSEHPKGYWKTIWYKDLSYDCQTLVEDLVQSSVPYVVQRWDDDFRRAYYAKAVAIAYDLGKEYNKNIFTKLKEWFLGLLKWRTWD